MRTIPTNIITRNMEPQSHIDSNVPDVILLRLSVGGLLGKLAIEYVPRLPFGPDEALFT